MDSGSVVVVDVPPSLVGRIKSGDTWRFNAGGVPHSLSAEREPGGGWTLIFHAIPGHRVQWMHIAGAMNKASNLVNAVHFLNEMAGAA